MKYAILGDIHSNSAALDTVLKHFDGKVDKYVSVGDIVGYAASPNECIQRVRELDSIVVTGNHDSAVMGEADITHFNPFARDAVIWTHDVVSKENMKYLETRSLIAHGDDFTIVHSSLDAPAKWTYIMSIDEADLCFRFQNTKLCFIGHTHYPGVFRSDGKYYPVSEGEFILDANFKYIVNAGSIGQPRDGDPRACAVEYDNVKNAVLFKRLDYDIKDTQDKIIKAGLPKILGERLLSGR